MSQAKWRQAPAAGTSRETDPCKHAHSKCLCVCVLARVFCTICILTRSHPHRQVQREQAGWAGTCAYSANVCSGAQRRSARPLQEHLHHAFLPIEHVVALSAQREYAGGRDKHGTVGRNIPQCKTRQVSLGTSPQMPAPHCPC